MDSSVDFCTPVELEWNPRTTLEMYEDSKWKMGLYMQTLVSTYGNEKSNGSGSVIFEDSQKLNEQLSPKIETADLIELYNTVVIYGKSYIKMTLDGEAIKPETTICFEEMMTQEYPKARYVLEPFFEAGTVNMVSAPPNTWKSWLLFLISAHIAKGTELFGKFPTEEQNILIVNEEDSFRAIQDRFKILGITDTKLPIFFRVANGSKLESKFIDLLLIEIKEKDIKVVIFDSLRSMHEADENDSTAMQKILDQMKKLAREGITVIFTHHHRKKNPFEKGSSAESSRGSSAINAAVAGHISLDEDNRDNGLYLVISHLKSKSGEKLDPFEVKIVKESENGKVKHVEFIYEGEFKVAEKKVGSAKDGIMSILSDGKWKPMKDFEKIKAGKTILRQALSVLKNNGMVLSITRKQAIKKCVPVTLNGKANELYYSINSDSAEAVTMADEVVAQSDWESLTNDHD